MAKNVITREKLEEFAVAYRSGKEIHDKEAIVQYLSGLGKKTVQVVSETPGLLFFLADSGMIPITDIDSYLLEVSWIEYPEVIEKLLLYKKNPPKIQTEAEAERKKTQAADPKNDWITEKMEDGTLKLVSYKGTDVDIHVPLKIGKSAVSTLGAMAFSPDKPRLKKEMAEQRKKIRSVEIPEGITAIWIGAFQSCNALKKLRIPNSIKTLPPYVLTKSGINNIVLPDDLEVIGIRAFSECRELKSISFPRHIKDLASSIFSGSALEEFLWPENDVTTELPDWIFAWCRNLTKVVLPNTLTKIGNNAFLGCIKLSQLSVPDSVTIIEKGAFCDCQELEELYIPDGVREIKEGTFTGCRSLKRLYLPKSVEKIEQGTRARFSDTRTFYGCEQLVICAPSGSCAENYAKEHRIPFESV